MNDLYFYAKDGYNKIEIKGKSIIYMRTAERNLKTLEKERGSEAIISYFDRWKDGMEESGFILLNEDACRILRDRWKQNL